MTYKNRLLLLITCIILLGNIVLFALIYVQNNRAMFVQIQNTALAIAINTVQALDADKVALIKSRADEETGIYQELIYQLRDIRNSNRNAGIDIAYLYTMMSPYKQPDIMMFGLDAEESLENKSHVGDVYKGTFGTKLRVSDQPVLDDTPSIDQWGAWISACAPIKNKIEVVAMLCVDLKYADVQKQTTRDLITSSLGSLSITLSLGLILAFGLASYANAPLRSLHRNLKDIGAGDFETKMDIKRKDEFGEIARTLDHMVEGLKQREALKSVFARYVSDKILNTVLEKGEQINVNGERRKVTIMFSDIRNFTALSENLNPEEVVSLLNEYFEAMIDIVFKYHGTLDKFIGDGMMVIFGAPEEDMYQEENAIRAALEMREKLDILGEKWLHTRNIHVSIGVGINTGIAIVGNIGSHRHMEYTAIGDTVNLAARLEGLTKVSGFDILVSDYTYIGARNLFEFQRLSEYALKGKQDTVVVHAVIKDKNY